MRALADLLLSKGEHAEATEWARRAAAQGDLISMLNLGVRLQRDGHAREAVSWLRRFANAQISDRLGNLSGPQLAMQHRLRQAYSALGRALGALPGTSPSRIRECLWLAREERKVFEMLFGVSERRLRRALSTRSIPAPVRAAAAEGDAEAMFLIGVLEWRGFLVDTDPDHPSDAWIEAARPWFVAAAKRGHVDAAFWLGESLYRCSRVDLAAATRWYAAAGKAAHPGALLRLGEIAEAYENDHRRAAECYRSAAMAAPAIGEIQVSAAWRLGRLYEQGHGVPQSDRSARLWYQRGSYLNLDPHPFVRLAAIHKVGLGCPSNDEIALAWSRHAERAWRGSTSAIQ
jgi:TPR repeat protein